MLKNSGLCSLLGIYGQLLDLYATEKMDRPDEIRDFMLQRPCLCLLPEKGFIVLAIDSIGQEERIYE